MCRTQYRTPWAQVAAEHSKRTKERQEAAGPMGGGNSRPGTRCSVGGGHRLWDPEGGLQKRTLGEHGVLGGKGRRLQAEGTVRAAIFPGGWEAGRPGLHLQPPVSHASPAAPSSLQNCPNWGDKFSARPPSGPTSSLIGNQRERERRPHWSTSDPQWPSPASDPSTGSRPSSPAPVARGAGSASRHHIHQACFFFLFSKFPIGL